MQTRFMVRLAAFGIMGGLLMFFGDLCFYLRPVSGADFIADPMMNKMGADRLIIGGVVGPLAGLLYALGSLLFYFAFSPHSKLLARMTTTLLGECSSILKSRCLFYNQEDIFTLD